MKYSYSVVIPHYNSSDLLPKMLASIPGRSDIQVIVCDDGSDAHHVEALKRLEHPGLELVLLEHHDAGYARNEGLRRAKGEWFIAADADDWFMPGAFDVLDRYRDLKDIDVLMFCIDVEEVDGRKKKILANESVLKYLKKPGKDTEKLIRFRSCTPWNKLVRLSFIRENNICFEDTEINNDVMYAFQVGLRAGNIHVIRDELYCLGMNQRSITRRKKSIEREFTFYLSRQKQNGFYRALGLMEFWRNDVLYIPYILMKHGVTGLFEFLRMWLARKDERNEARKAYLHILDGRDAKTP